MVKKSRDIPSRNQTQSASDHASRKVAIVVAVIAASATIFAAIISRWSVITHETPRNETSKYVGKIVNKTTGDAVRTAKASLEGKGEVPAVTFTDSEGVFSFPLKDTRTEIHIRVEADGYDKFDLVVVPLNNAGIQLIPLTPLPSSARPIPSASPPKSHSDESSNNNLTTATTASGFSTVSGNVIDATTGEPLSGARISIIGEKDVGVSTDKDGRFSLTTHGSDGRMVWIRAARDGYIAGSQLYQIGSQEATIRLYKHKS
jgi:hypothetical protein